MSTPRIGLEDSRALELELRAYGNAVDQENAEKLARARCRVDVPRLEREPRTLELFGEVSR